MTNVKTQSRHQSGFCLSAGSCEYNPYPIIPLVQNGSLFILSFGFWISFGIWALTFVIGEIRVFPISRAPLNLYPARPDGPEDLTGVEFAMNRDYSTGARSGNVAYSTGVLS
jgi:hypothetical protein